MKSGGRLGIAQCQAIENLELFPDSKSVYSGSIPLEASN